MNLGMTHEGRCRPVAALLDADESTSPFVLPTDSNPTVASVKANWPPGQTLDQLSFPCRDV